MGQSMWGSILAGISAAVMTATILSGVFVYWIRTKLQESKDMSDRERRRAEERIRLVEQDATTAREFRVSADARLATLESVHDPVRMGGLMQELTSIGRQLPELGVKIDSLSRELTETRTSFGDLKDWVRDIDSKLDQHIEHHP